MTVVGCMECYISIPLDEDPPSISRLIHNLLAGIVGKNEVTHTADLRLRTKAGLLDSQAGLCDTGCGVS